MIKMYYARIYWHGKTLVTPIVSHEHFDLYLALNPRYFLVWSYSKFLMSIVLWTNYSTFFFLLWIILKPVKNLVLVNRFCTEVVFSQLYLFLKGAEFNFFTWIVLLQDSFYNIMRNHINSMPSFPSKILITIADFKNAHFLLGLISRYSYIFLSFFHLLYFQCQSMP